MDRPTKPSGRHAVRLRRDEIITRLSYRFNFLAIRGPSTRCRRRDYEGTSPPLGRRLRADLDAWYALAYGLSRDELRYVLDPKEVMGADYPSETFRVLQKNEIAKYGEYRTARLVMAAYDRLTSDGMCPRTEGYR
jgi:hypothetical protein